jgi:hypothetical protein
MVQIPGWFSLLFLLFPLYEELGRTDLLESLVVDETCSIFRNLQLAFLNLLTKLPGQ